jgi:hypothetical protein
MSSTKMIILFMFLSVSCAYNDTNDDIIQDVLDMIEQEVSIDQMVRTLKVTAPQIEQLLKDDIHNCKVYGQCQQSKSGRVLEKFQALIQQYEVERMDELLFTHLDPIEVFLHAQRNALGRIFEDLEYARLSHAIMDMKTQNMPELELFLEEYCKQFGCSRFT